MQPALDIKAREENDGSVLANKTINSIYEDKYEDKMPKRLLLLLLLAILSRILPADEIFVVNSESRTLSKIDLISGAVNNSFTQLGLTPNLLCMEQDWIYVVLSGANSIQMINRITGTTARTIFIASSVNPWDVVKEGDYLYVSGLFTDKVYKISLQSYSVVAQLSVGVSPEGLAVHGNKLYVCNTGGYASGYANSSVSVIDLDSFSVIKTIPVWTNPQALQVYEDQIHVVCTGNWSSVSGAVDIIDTTIDERTDRILVGGNPWSIWISPTGIGYLGEGLNSGVYHFDANTLSLINGSTNPLSPGAIMVHGSSDAIALLSANWGQNGVVYLRNTDWSPVSQYTVALVPTDLWYYQIDVETNDELMPLAQVQLYPNPVCRNGFITLKSDITRNETINIYNLKGRKVFSGSVQRGENRISLPQAGIGSGLYFYKLKNTVGKLVVY